MARIIDALTQFFDDNGDPLINGKLKFVESGTNNTDKDTFADISETIVNSNPVLLDGAGRCPNIFGTGSYNVILYTSADVQIAQFDPVSGDTFAGAFSNWNSATIYAEDDIVTGSDGKYYRSIVGANQNQDPTTSPGQWEEVQLLGVWNTNVTYATNEIVSYQGVFYASVGDGNIGNVPLGDVTNWKSTSSPSAVIGSITKRNTVQTGGDALTQAGSAQTGMSSTIYTGNGTSQSINNGIDMNTGDFGGLTWIKSRGSILSHKFTDTVRGATFSLSSDSTAVEATEAGGLTAFSATGFDLGSDLDYNTNTDTLVAWSFQTTKKTSGLTNRNKAYTCHYNPDMNFSIVGYEGDGADGHEIPHHLPVVPELSIYKSRDSVVNWGVSSKYAGNSAAGDYLRLNTTDALLNSTSLVVIPNANTVRLDGAWAGNNAANNNVILYNFASKSGVCKIGKYIGTGAAGNYVSTEVLGGDGFKPSFVMVKNLTTAQSWQIIDAIRGANSLLPNVSNAEVAVTTEGILFDDNGFILESTALQTNQLNSEYLFIAFAETSIDATKAWADFTVPTNADEITVTNPTRLSFAKGSDDNGNIDAQETIAGATISYGVGHEDKHYYFYRDNGTAWGQTEVRPLVAWKTRNDADKYGEVSPSDITLRTTSKHFGYESDSGVVLASGDTSTYFAYKAFDKDSNDVLASGENRWIIAATTNSWLQYKHTEPRILKSWRMREGTNIAQTPENFTIEGSNDGLNWTAIDSAYAAGGYQAGAANGLQLWGDLQDTSINTTAYLYHRINITLNNGDVNNTQIAELEFNTIIAADYYLVEEGKMYNSSDVAIERVYLGEFKTDASGDVINETIINYSPLKEQITEAEIHGDLIVHGDIRSKRAILLEVYIDGTLNPPIIESGSNVIDIVDLSTGQYTIIPSDEIRELIKKNNASIFTSTYTQDTTITARLNNDGTIYVLTETTSGTLVNEKFYITVIGDNVQ